MRCYFLGTLGLAAHLAAVAAHFAASAAHLAAVVAHLAAVAAHLAAHLAAAPDERPFTESLLTSLFAIELLLMCGCRERHRPKRDAPFNKGIRLLRIKVRRFLHNHAFFSPFERRGLLELSQIRKVKAFNGMPQNRPISYRRKIIHIASIADCDAQRLARKKA